jgi:aryl-alcohol dehydrogenase-like predicted oxidoreductase
MLLPAAKQANFGIIPRVPLASGFLSGKYSRDTQFGERDHRSRMTAEQKRDWAEKANRLKPIATELGITLAQLALQYILANDGVSVVIPGARNENQARQNAAAGKLPPLSDAMVAKIRKAVE